MRSTVLLTTGVLTLAALTACSSGGAPANQQAPASSSAAAAKISSPAEFVTAVNAAMQAKKTAHLNSSAGDSRKPGKTEDTTGQLRFEEGGETSAKVVAKDETGETTVLRLPGEMYLQAASNEEETPGKPWRKAKVGGDDLAAKLLVPMLTIMLDKTDPSRERGHFAAAGQWEAPATEQVDGVAATRYTITVDYAKAAAATKDELAKKSLESKVKLNRSTAKHEIWLDANNLPLRWKLTESGKVEFTTTLEARFKDWGKAVEIAAPPADKVGEPKI